MDWTALFPHLSHRLLLLWAEGRPDGVVLHVAFRADTVCCPSCHRPSAAIHSHYVRRVTDLPLGSQRVTFQVSVRRFRCRNPACPRKTFAEDCSPIVARYARRSAALQALLEDIGVHLGGRPGTRFAGRHALAASRSTLLRVVRRLPLPPQLDHIAVLGVDDFALRRTHHYGTLVVDVEHHRMLDLWPERTAEPFVAWLGACQPQPEFICRDRGGTYAEAARQGAPEALQVADRFHLVRNAGDVLQRVLARHADDLRAVTTSTTSREGTEGTGGVDPVRSGPPRVSTPHTSDRRRARYDQVVALRAAGCSLATIAKRVELSRPTVRKYLAAQSFPAWAPRRTLLRAGAASTVHLQRRWAEGCHDATVLWGELQVQGFSGSLRMVQRAVTAWRGESRVRGSRRRVGQAEGPVGVATAPGLPETARGGSSSAGVPPAETAGAHQSHAPPSPDAPPPPPRALSPQQAAWLLLRPVDGLNDSEQSLRTQLVERSPEIRLAHELVETFRSILQQREPERLDPWMTRAITSGIPEVRGFAFGLKRDYNAVRAAATVEWSSGQVEGQVTKLKLIKRQMYGRANFDLLRRRVLLAS